MPAAIHVEQSPERAHSHAGPVSLRSVHAPRRQRVRKQRPQRSDGRSGRSQQMKATEIQESTTPALKRELGLLDLTLFYVASTLSVRWIATAAAAGSSTLVVWMIALCCFFLPLAASVLELSSRYPNEGGLYVWTQRAFGDFTGFIAAWSYWMSNLSYFPAVLYFGAGSALF